MDTVAFHHDVVLTHDDRSGNCRYATAGISPGLEFGFQIDPLSIIAIGVDGVVDYPDITHAGVCPHGSIVGVIDYGEYCRSIDRSVEVCIDIDA